MIGLGAGPSTPSADTLDGAAVEQLVSDIERELRASEQSIIRVDVVPTG